MIPVIFRVYLCVLQGTATRAAPKEPLLQSEQRPADHWADERAPEVFGTVRMISHRSINMWPLTHRATQTPKLVNHSFQTHRDTWLLFSQQHEHTTCNLISLLTFFSRTLQSPLLLSDSCLHLFLQSQLCIPKMEACAAGRTQYSVGQAVQRCCGLRRFHSEEDLQKDLSMFCDSDSDRYCNVFFYSNNSVGSSKTQWWKVLLLKYCTCEF